ncbi:hypothetical protein [Wolbachia endosymbiont of Dirofilaria (Dirofilaria) immitis]|uniref:hypothetical protein n=1 Tax=Wolbachia endosymbiont of Dirofilaria (Dirofilaria) immitis TaxID=1812115 RepID=UPI00158833B3|nr:hypothetical protein [Wolbachia endosymbiont of Dirofilaria (Dirofilaria) immitis]QKX02066.1 hypothetical protein GOY12_00455 [Wolbachia endosymbiont of Dirofilaria (Dirofilaria) immitis]
MIVRSDFMSMLLLILATVCFGVLMIFFNFIKKKFFMYKIKSFLENEVNSEWAKYYGKELVGECIDQGWKKI